MKNIRKFRAVAVVVAPPVGSLLVVNQQSKIQKSEIPEAPMATFTEVKPEAVTLSNDEILRYSRHLIMPEVGMEGQLKIKAAKVLCIGAGGLGSPLALYLAAAGVGTLGVVDFDVVDYTNLQRQIIHTTADVAEEAGLRRGEAEGDQSVSQHQEVRHAADQRQCSRNFQRLRHHRRRHRQLSYALSGERCLRADGKPNVYGFDLPLRRTGQFFATKDGPCYRCLYPEPPPPGLVPSCAEGGVLGILPGLLGVIQATETIKLILESGDPLIGRLLAGRRARHEVPRTQAAEESGLPGLRHASHHHEADRLQ